MVDSLDLLMYFNDSYLRVKVANMDVTQHFGSKIDKHDCCTLTLGVVLFLLGGDLIFQVA